MYNFVQKANATEQLCGILDQLRNGFLSDGFHP